LIIYLVELIQIESNNNRHNSISSRSSTSGESNTTNETDLSGTTDDDSSIGQLVIPTINENDEVDSEVLKMISQQIIHYKTGDQERECSNVLNNIQRYVRQIFRMVKFFSDDKDDFKEPDFVTEKGRNRQASKICIYLFKSLKQREGEVLELISFWKTYRKIVKKDLNKMRASDINSFKVKFINGK